MPVVETKKAINPFYYELERVFHALPPMAGKADRAAAIDGLTVEVNGMTFQVDEISLNRINWVLGTASFMFAKGMASGLSAAQAYQAVYINTPVQWRTADDVNVDVNAAAVGVLMQQGTTAFSNVWFQY